MRVEMQTITACCLEDYMWLSQFPLSHLRLSF